MAPERQNPDLVVPRPPTAALPLRVGLRAVREAHAWGATVVAPAAVSVILGRLLSNHTAASFVDATAFSAAALTGTTLAVPALRKRAAVLHRRATAKRKTSKNIDWHWTEIACDIGLVRPGDVIDRPVRLETTPHGYKLRIRIPEHIGVGGYDDIVQKLSRHSRIQGRSVRWMEEHPGQVTAYFGTTELPTEYEITDVPADGTVAWMAGGGHVTLNFDDCHHLLIVGATGGGKTHTENLLTASEMKRGSIIYGIDMGGAGEMRWVKGYGHPVAENLREACGLMEEFYAIIRSRLAEMAERGGVDEVYDGTRIILRVNEAATLLDAYLDENDEEKDYRDRISRLLYRILIDGRKVRANFLGGIQRADVQVIGKRGGFIRNNARLIAIGELDADGVDMVFNGSATEHDRRELSRKIPGRALSNGLSREGMGGDVHAVQFYYLPKHRLASLNLPKSPARPRAGTVVVEHPTIEEVLAEAHDAPQVPAPAAKPKRRTKGDVMQQVLDALREDGPLLRSEIADAIGIEPKQGTLSSALAELQQRNMIAVTAEGKAHRYAIPETA